MKSFFLSLVLIFSANFVFAQNYTAVSYNIRLNLESDASNWWEYRKERLSNQLEYLAPDVFGTQEGLPEQIAYLDERFPDFSYVGVGRDDGKSSGEYSAIFYHTDTFELIDSGTFWLSETPETPSMGWDAEFPRICTYALLRDVETNQHLWVFNTHLDHVGEKARLASVKLIHQKIQELNTDEYPLVLMGDFNATPDSPPITYLIDFLNDSRAVSKTEPEGPVGTFNNFEMAHPLDERIDYIFVSGGIEVQQYQAVVETSYSHFPSDHLPVVVDFSIE